MSDKKRKVPKLRFPGFTDAWEQRKLGEVVDVTMGQSPNSSNYTDNPEDYILVQGNADMKDGRVFPRVWTTQVTKKAHKGDLILSVRAPVGDVGKTDYDVVIGRGVASIKGNEFIFQLLGKMKLEGYWDKLSTGSTFDSINSSDIKSSEIYSPNADEQTLMGEFFVKIDSLISLHQRKLDNVKMLKKSLLQKLFPKDGEKIPELRFPGFTDDWEQQKLGEVVNKCYGGGTPRTSVEEYWTGNIPWLQSSNLIDDDVQNAKVEKFISENAIDSSAAKMIPSRSIAVVTRVGIGKLVLMDKDFATSQDFLSLSGILLEEQFMLYALYILLKSEKRKGQGTSIKGITKEVLLNKDIRFPGNSIEQLKTGNFFKLFDALISLHQRKLDHLKELKKGLLQQMFV